MKEIEGRNNINLDSKIPQPDGGMYIYRANILEKLYTIIYV